MTKLNLLLLEIYKWNKKENFGKVNLIVSLLKKKIKKNNNNNI